MSRKRRPVVYARPPPLPQIPTFWIAPRYRRAILPLALVVCLFSTAYIWFRTEQANESMRRYEQAGLCRSATERGCRREIAAMVVQLQRKRGSKDGVEEWVTLQLPDGTHQLRNWDGNLYDTLHEGMVVQATVWDEQVVELHDETGHHLVTDTSPAAQEHAGAVFRIGGVLFSYVLIILLIKRIWLDKTPTPPAASTLPPLPTFPAPAQTRSLLDDSEAAHSLLEGSRAGTGAKTQSLKQPSDRHSV